MKLCLVSKYPPIEGGVSANAYWLARGLAERGHEIHVVTNAEEVEEPYRLTLDASDGFWYEPSFEISGGRVWVSNPEPMSPRTMGFIPQVNPFVTKLASVATDVVRHHRCDVIVGYYYEPYGIAAWLASRWSGAPLLLKHAGSDLGRLFRVPDLSTAYREILSSAEAVMTRPSLFNRFQGFGVDRARLVRNVPFSLPTQVFTSNVAPLDLGRFALSGLAAPSAAFDPAVPSVGIYGKIGKTKGTHDLLAALGYLAAHGLVFRLVAMVGQTQGDQLSQAISEADLADRTTIVPLLPNWRVPSFIRACTVVCFLERQFSITTHDSIIPREVLACGGCLVVSAEVAAKQYYRGEMVSGHNVVIIDDPTNHVELAHRLRSVLEDPTRAADIGSCGHHVSRSIENHAAFIDGWETVLLDLSQPRPSTLRLPTTADDLASIAPVLFGIIQAGWPQLLKEFYATALPRDPLTVGLAFCDAIAQHCCEVPTQLTARLSVAVYYQRARLRCTYSCERETVSAFPVTDCLLGQAVTATTVGALWPVRGASVFIEQFDVDVSSLFIGAPAQGSFGGDPAAQLLTLPASRNAILFQRTANLVPVELRINDATCKLVNSCDGTRTTNDLIEHMARYLCSVDTAPLREDVAIGVITALDRLYQAGVLVFGERRQGLGWSGGLRPADAEWSARLRMRRDE